MHTDFASVLEVLFHAALDAFRSLDGASLSAEKLLEECQQSIEDLATISFEYFGKTSFNPVVTSLRRQHLCGYPSLQLQAS